MTGHAVQRVEVLLSAQRALLGYVFPALRAVRVVWTQDSVRLVAYVDGELTEEDREAISCASTEILADFPAEVNVREEIVRCDAPARIPPLAVGTHENVQMVYERRE